MFRVGIDVGGTFTDLVAVDDAGRVTPRQVRLHARRSVRSASSTGLGAARRRAGHRPRRAPGRHRAHRARHHRGHQRAARAQGRDGRHADHRGPPRRHRDARGAQGRSLQPAHAAPGAAGAARAPARRDGADALRRHAWRRRSRRPRAEAAIRRLGAARAWTRWRSAICTPTAIRATSGRRGKLLARLLPGRLRVAVLRRAAADQGVRALLDHRGQRLRRPGARALSVAAWARGCRRRATAATC